jgi:hypothetical protein
MGLARRIDDKRLRNRRQHPFDLGRENATNLIGRNALLEAAFANRRRNTRRRGYAEIGLNEQIFKIVDGRRIELTLGKKVRDARGELR